MAKKEATETIFRLIREESLGWITFDILKIMDKRDLIYKQTLEEPQNQTLITKFRKISKMIKNKIKHSRKNYFKNKIKKASTDSRKVWAAINAEVKGKQQNNPASEIRDKKVLFTKLTSKLLML